MSVLEGVGLIITFWHKTGAVYREEHRHDDSEGGAGTRVALKSKVTWLCSLFFFTYMGVEGTWSLLPQSQSIHPFPKLGSC